MAPPALPPRLIAATERQLEAWRAALTGGAERVGWKLGLRIAEIESVIGTQPAIGHLTTLTVVADGAAHAAAGARELRAETELVVEAGAGGSVAGHAVALELVDVARPPADLEGIVAANVLHRAVVLGPTLRGATPVTGARATLVVDGELRESGRVEADGPAALAAVARVLEAVGERLEPGDRVLTGSITHVPVGAGQAVTAAIEGLGSACVRLA
jgi:2-keto-4-pentenoate hydratase